MSIAEIPRILLQDAEQPELFFYDLKMTNNAVKSKINLGMNMFSFLQIGKKHVHFAGNHVAVNHEQSLLLKKGNWLWTELLDTGTAYFCKLLFFSENILKAFLKKHCPVQKGTTEAVPYFVIKNDVYINAYVNSLATIGQPSNGKMKSLLHLKFEELLLYLLNKYGKAFETYLHSMIAPETSLLKKIVESDEHNHLKVEEIAFLCHMSLSSFKRHFFREYHVSPGKWLRDQRLQRAKQRLQNEGCKPSDIYMDFGYNNLSNFSNAFKNRFGQNPSAVKTN